MSRRTRSKAAVDAGDNYMRRGNIPSSTNPALPSPQDPVRQKCEYVLGILRDIALPFSEFVNAVSYGENTLRNSPLAREARDKFYQREPLSRFLDNLYAPPRPPSGGGPRPIGGSRVLKDFIFKNATETFRSELEEFCDGYGLANEDITNMDYISTITSESLYRKIKETCPRLHASLSALTVPRPVDAEEVEDENEALIGPKRAVEKHPHFVGHFREEQGAFTHLND
ncbi:hypothetical protein FS749_015065 [Ceratobasidium sp. UAMH 11750]|nr:hypothetical protein FS749_015065 [Ceratobasidium sp. UAMH 11750]